MADYWQHWINLAKNTTTKLPSIYYVNWFRKDENGNYLWPGFGENSRVLKWIFDRCEGKAEVNETPIGNVPSPDAIDFSGLKLSSSQIEHLLKVEIDGWLKEIPMIKAYYEEYHDRLPKELSEELEGLKSRLESAKQSTQ